jgi:hypothetical protein
MLGRTLQDGRPFTLWSEDMLELFAHEVLPRLRSNRG